MISWNRMLSKKLTIKIQNRALPREHICSWTCKTATASVLVTWQVDWGNECCFAMYQTIVCAKKINTCNPREHRSEVSEWKKWSSRCCRCVLVFVCGWRWKNYQKTCGAWQQWLGRSNEADSPGSSIQRKLLVWCCHWSCDRNVQVSDGRKEARCWNSFTGPKGGPFPKEMCPNCPWPGSARQRQSLIEDAEKFEKLLITEWSDRISHYSLTTLGVRKFNKPDLLPLAEDLKKLRKSVLERVSQYTDSLQRNPSLEAWGLLAKATLGRLVMFHKRRGGEASKMLLASYDARPDWTRVNSQEMSSLDALERELSWK